MSDLFDEDESYSPADEILNQLDEDQLDAPDSEALNWAVQRIEEANLFKHLLVTPIFTENSADAAIVASVNAKISRFAMEELKELLGGKREEKLKQIESQFNENEVFALKTIAAKVIEKTGGTQPAAPTERTPTINSIDVGNRQISTNKVATASNPPKTNNPAPAARPSVSTNKASQKKVAPAKSTKNMTAEEKKKHDLVQKNNKRVTPTSPIQPIAQPVNGSWAQGQAFNNERSGNKVLSSIVGLELAMPATAPAASEGADSAIEFDPDQQ
jgi:hypothetical protein